MLGEPPEGDGVAPHVGVSTLTLWVEVTRLLSLRGRTGADRGRSAPLGELGLLLARSLSASQLSHGKEVGLAAPSESLTRWPWVKHVPSISLSFLL